MRQRHLEILNNITQAVHKSLDLEEVYNIALDMTIALQNVDMAMIYLIDEERREAALKAHRNVPEDYISRAGRIPYPKGVTWKVINSGKILNIEDAQKDPDIGPAGRDLGHHGILGIPITLEDTVIGVIWFISYKERKFDESEVNLLSTFGNQIAIAIAKAKLYRELSKKNKYETIVSTVTRSVHRSINFQDVLENAVEAMNENIDKADTIAIYMVEGERAVLRAYRGLTSRYIERAQKIPCPKGLTWKTIIEGKPIYCEDVDQDTVIGPAGREIGIKSYLCMPIHTEGRTVGSLNIASFRKNAFDQEDLKLLEIVTQQIEVAINNARQAGVLRESEERYRTLVEFTYDLICETSIDGRFLYINPKHKDVIGYEPDELLGRSIFEHIHPDDRFAVMAEFQRAAVAFSLGYVVYRYRHKNGEWHWLESTGKPFQTATGEIRGIIASRDITDRKRAEGELIRSREQLRALAARLQSVREEERTHIAREIHDELGQKLTALQMSLSWLDRKLSKADNNNVMPRSILLGEIATMLKIIDTSIQTVQEISTELRPVILDDFGLTAAIKWQAQEFQTRMGVRCKFISSPENIVLDKERSTAIFRILQEALTNVARHARATRVNISLKERSGNLILEVMDNGKGITEDAISNPKSLGLLGMRERAILFGGEVNISGIPGKGTKVTVRVPLNRR